MYRQLSRSRVPLLAEESEYSVMHRYDGFHMLRFNMQRQCSAEVKERVRSCLHTRNLNTIVRAWKLVWFIN